MATSVLFSTDERIAAKFAKSICFVPSKEQDVLLINERRQVNQGQVRERPNEKFVFNERERPQTKYGGGFV